MNVILMIVIDIYLRWLWILLFATFFIAINGKFLGSLIWYQQESIADCKNGWTSLSNSLSIAKAKRVGLFL